LARAKQLLARANRPNPGAISQDREWSGVDQLDKIEIPMLIIVGDEDVPEIVSAAHFLAALCPKARLEQLAGAAHLPNLERPRDFDAILTDWLHKTEASPHLKPEGFGGGH
jgi:pimeloyl-ACP methyl ester carboxylesterase